MRGFHAPEFTKDDIRKLLTKDDLKEVLYLMGYTLVPKEENNKKKNSLDKERTYK